MPDFQPIKSHFRKILFFAIFIVIFQNICFTQTSPSSFFVEFKDKKNTSYSVSDPLKYLSQRALNRREKNHVAVTEQDFPVNSWYLDSLKAAGAQILFTSRWFNAATVRVDTDTVMTRISKLTFVKSYQKVYKIKGKRTQTENILSAKTNFNDNDYGESFPQIAMMNGQLLHQLGFTGKGVIIGVIDAGFFHADSLQAFKYLFDNHRILATHDFVQGNDSVYDDATHGMAVLSSMGGRLTGKLLGTAPEASFILLRSENVSSEYLIEEDAWTAAAEFADSAGVDVINSSLGYTTFDDSSMNHTHSDLDGKTTRVTRAANYAFSKGIVVVCSAGNEGNHAWKYISAPGDGDSVLTIGSVDINRKHSPFSSLGPNASNHLKPNVAAMGQNTIVASTFDGEITTATGTSLSGPLVAGMTACLIDAFPEKTNKEIKKAIEMSASQYTHPDDSVGYGIPDFYFAWQMLNLTRKNDVQEDFKVVQLYPNPFITDISFTYYSKINRTIKINVTDNIGRIVYDSSILAKANMVDKISLGLNNIHKTGLFLLTIDSGIKKITVKLIKLTAD